MTEPSVSYLVKRLRHPRMATFRIPYSDDPDLNRRFFGSRWSRVNGSLMFRRTALCSFLLLATIFAAEGGNPSVKAAVAPEYPPVAVVGRVSGIVSIRVAIDEGGVVTHADLVQGHPMLKTAALDAAKKWRFAPGIPATLVLKFNFTILPEKGNGRIRSHFSST